MRLFTVRGPTVLTGPQTAAFGIQSHPPAYRSPRFERWLRYCTAGDTGGLRAEMLDFLYSRESVKTFDDLGEGWSRLIGALQAQGPRQSRDATLRVLREGRTETLFTREGRVQGVARTALADTMLALAHLRHLGHPDNPDYQGALRVMAFAERAVALKLQLPETDVRRHFTRPVLLHPCFGKMDPCRRTEPGQPFPFLRGREDESERWRHTPGCVSDGDCTCKVNDACVEQSRCCARVVPYVADLMIVRDHTRCYQAGDLSHITNVLAGEELSNTVRRLDRVEEVSETERQTTRHAERDLQTEDRTALKTEIGQTVQEDMALDAGVTANASWGKGMYSVSSSSSFSFSKSKEASNKVTRDYAQNVVARAVEKVEEKLTTSLKVTRIRELEETSEHGFSNVSGPNVSGQYLYVNKRNRAQLYNYGKAGLIDLFLPEPAALFLRLIARTFGREAPRAPEPFTLTPDDITPETYEGLAAEYGIRDAPAPPPFRRRVEVTLEGEPGDPKGKNKKSGSHIFNFSVTVPPDYEGVAMDVNSIRLNYNEGGGVSISATLGPDGNYVFHEDGGSYMFTSTLPNIQGTHTVTVHTWDVTNFTWILAVDCALTPEAKARWQGEVFARVEEVAKARQEAYDKALAEYLEAKAEFDAEEEARLAEIFNGNPFTLRVIERKQLKQMAISYISCQFFDEFDAMKQRVAPCGFPSFNVAEAEREGRIVRFFEQAFSWSLMTYVFYPYFWGRKCTWPDKLNARSGDPIFEAFMSAGYAHVQVPVREGFLDLVQYFLATGEIWGATHAPPLPGDPHHVSVAQEIMEQMQNFYADRPGAADVVQGSDEVTIHGTDAWWTHADPLAVPPVAAGVNPVAVDADLDREINLDGTVYRITDIQPDPSATPTSWIVTLDRPYEGATASSLQWSTGAVYVGAPWEFVTPTTLTFLRDPSPCLPCYPLAECVE